MWSHQVQTSHQLEILRLTLHLQLNMLLVQVYPQFYSPSLKIFLKELDDARAFLLV